MQRALVDEAVRVLAPDGMLVYSVCTLSTAESRGIDSYVAAAHPELVPVVVEGGPWRRDERGARLLPQDQGTDGMCLFRYRYR